MDEKTLGMILLSICIYVLFVGSLCLTAMAFDFLRDIFLGWRGR